MHEFLGCISVAEAMGKMYGPLVRMVTAIAGFLAISGLIAVQFKVAATLLAYFLNISEVFSVFFISIIVIIYSSAGGIKAVTFTDILQFITFIIAIPIIVLLLWQDIPNIESVLQIIKSKSDYHLHINNSEFKTLIELSCIFIIPALHPSIFQRIAMNNSIENVQRSFFMATILGLVLIVITGSLGILMFTINPHLNAETLWIYIIDNYTGLGFKGLAIIGVIAMVMSTADSYLNSSSILIAYDIVGLLKKYDGQKLLSFTRWTSLLVGLVSVYLALYGEDILNLILIANNFYVPIVSVPLLLSILGTRIDSKGVLLSMLAGGITVILWRIYLLDETKIDSLLPASFANFITYLGYRVINNKS